MSEKKSSGCVFVSFEMILVCHFSQWIEFQRLVEVECLKRLALKGIEYSMRIVEINLLDHEENEPIDQSTSLKNSAKLFFEELRFEMDIVNSRRAKQTPDLASMEKFDVDEKKKLDAEEKLDFVVEEKEEKEEKKKDVDVEEKRTLEEEEEEFDVEENQKRVDVVKEKKEDLTLFLFLESEENWSVKEETTEVEKSVEEEEN